MRKPIPVVTALLTLVLWSCAHLVSAAPVITALTLSPGTTTLAAGQTVAFSLTATLADATTTNVTENATWVPNGAGLTGIPGQKGQFAAVAKGTWTLTATVGTLSASATVTITPGPVVTLNVLPTAAQLTADDFLPMGFYGVDAEGNGFDVSQAVTVSTTDPKGTVSASGYTPGMVGTWSITTTLGSLADTTTVTVTPGKLVSLIVAPNELTIDPGDTATLSARGFDADGNDTNPTVTWRASNNQVATVDANGSVKGTATGQTNIYAEANGVFGSIPIIVTGASVVVTPSSDVVSVTKPSNRTPQVAAEEVERVPDVSDTTVDDQAISTAPSVTPCKNIPHPWTVILLIAHLIVLSVFFTLLRRGRRYPWWWVPPLALTAAMLGVYAGAFCKDTYLWWPWSIIGISVIFFSVYYQRLDEPSPPPPKQAPPA